MSRIAAPLSALLFACLLPAGANATTNARDLCVAAERDPAGFVERPDFADSILRMATRCPELALALTNTATGSIAGVTDTDGKGKDKITSGPDFSDLVDRLKVATRNLGVATANVEKAQAALERTIRRAKDSGLSEADLQALYAMEGEGGKNILPDYTNAKRKALENYIEARDRLATAEEKLDQANEKAKPLVEKALELAGMADVAKADLANVLGDMTAEAKQAMLDKALADAKQQVAELEERIAAAQQAFDDASKSLKSALNHKPYTKALEEFEDEQRDYARATKNLAEAEEKFAAAEARLKEKLAADNRCTGKACRDARQDAMQAAGQLSSAENDVKRQARDLEKAQKDLEKLERSLDLAGLSEAYNAQAAALAASQAAQALARDLADTTSRQSKELSDLLASATEALTKAQAASDEAKAATAAEEAEVAAASAALEKAIAEAKTALEGSPEELAALFAVHDAKAVLQEALDALGAAQVDADALIEEVADMDKVPSEVKEAAEDLSEAATEGEAASEEATDTKHKAGETIIDYHEAEGDLRDALAEEEAEQSNDDTAEKDAEEGSDEAGQEAGDANS